jgi:potassium efflux system protein
MVLLILAIMFMASQNLPGFIEMAVFSHLRLDRGSGYAITATMRYVIVLVGVILAARGLGLSWNKVQWLAAAVTVGIGFGLQEIFANFVSGLILLFERPLRVGDIVTVGDTSGVVARIQIRATTIRDWDNRELILPNKTLITGGFVNWTLSDSITRIVCNVGIAYEANPREARELLLAIARRHPAILAEPAPLVTFEGFGDSTLNLALRAHVARTDQRAAAIFDLHATILDEFRKAGLEIAFPQRDLHLRSVPPGWALTPPAAPDGGATTPAGRG